MASRIPMKFLGIFPRNILAAEKLAVVGGKMLFLELPLSGFVNDSPSLLQRLSTRRCEMKITVDMVMAANPCAEYPLSRVEVLWAGRESLTPREIAALEIPEDDRLWALISRCLDERQQRLFACDCAERALTLVGSPDPRSVEAIRVARMYAAGDATKEQLAAARAAAWDAARAAAWDAAWAAARAARDAAWAAAWAAAWDAAWDAQIQIAVEYAEGAR
jgi:hypothetical protein